LAVTLSSTPTTGNKILVWASCGSTGSFTVSSVADSNSNSLTSLASVLEAGSADTALALFAYDVPATPSSTFTATFSGAGGFGVLAQEISGLMTGNTSAMLDGTAGTAHTSGTSLSATYSSTATNEYLGTCYGDDGFGITGTIPSGYTADTNNINTSSNANLMVAYKNSTGGSETNTWTTNGTDDMCVITVAFQLPVSGFSSGPNYAGGGSALGGGTGTWANISNAEGAPDTAVATWTAP
jgi:hypothetical protein